MKEPLDDSWASVGEQADRIDNLIAASQMALPAETHLAYLRESLTDVRAQLRAAYVLATGSNPWTET